MADLNIKPNALFTADNLYVLNGINSDCVDLIYLDPPFNSKRLYKAPVGSKAAGAAFEDMWRWDDVDAALMVRLTDEHPHLVDYITSIEKSHGRAMMAYIAYMAQRLFEMQRVLKPSGSIYLHCDPTAGHYLKIIMDNIFGTRNFRNEIIWHYSGPQRPSRKNFGAKHDTILRYSKSDRYCAVPEGIAPLLPLGTEEISGLKKQGGRYYYDLPTGDYTDESIQRLEKEGRIRRTAKGKPRVMYFMEQRNGEVLRAKQLPDVWSDITAVGHAGGKERTGYPTQKPLALLKRIIAASSNEGGIVLDPFCGCATTCVAAQHLHRNWIGIDISETTADLIRSRLADDVGALFDGFTHFTGLPERRDVRHISKQRAKPDLYRDQQGYCNGCNQHFEFRNLSVDHIIPRAKGGGNFYENYQLLCGNCNSVKGDRPMEYLISVVENRGAKRSVFGRVSRCGEWMPTVQAGGATVMPR